MSQNIFAQFVFPSPKVLHFNEKRLHWASLVRVLKSIPINTYAWIYLFEIDLIWHEQDSKTLSLRSLTSPLKRLLKIKNSQNIWITHFSRCYSSKYLILPSIVMFKHASNAKWHKLIGKDINWVKMTQIDMSRVKMTQVDNNPQNLQRVILSKFDS